jgi:hypothetical protein
MVGHGVIGVSSLSQTLRDGRKVRIAFGLIPVKNSGSEIDDTVSRMVEGSEAESGSQVETAEQRCVRRRPPISPQSPMGGYAATLPMQLCRLRIEHRNH